jgi:hypothetical protein
VTRSPYLVRNSREQYYALGYENDDQDVSFLSFAEYLASLRVPAGRELQYRDFARWFAGHRVASRLDDPYQVFEEFQGVLTGAPTDRAYLEPGGLPRPRRQAVDLPARGARARVRAVPQVPRLPARARRFFDANLLSFEYLPLVEPRYDFIVVDEVQDVTTVQLDVDPAVAARARAVHPVRRREPDRAPQLLLVVEAQELLPPGGGAPTAHPDPERQLPQLGAGDRAREPHPEAQDGALRLVDRESHYLVAAPATGSGAVLLLPTRRTSPTS